MAPTTQKALGSPEVGADWKLYTNRIVPKPGPHDVFVKVVVASINPADAFVQKFGAPFITTYPWYGGIEGAGIVEELGSEVTSFTKGDKVFFPGGMSNDGATFQEYCIVPISQAVCIPDSISFEQAVTIPVGLATVVTGIWAHHPEASSINLTAPWEQGGLTKYAGTPALVVGGSSSVGQYAIQMAELQGFSPIITVASPKHEAFLRSLGATHVVDRTLTHEQVLAELPKITGGTPILYAYDAIGRDATTQHLAYDALAPGGGLVVTHPRSQEILAEREKRDNGSIRVARPFASFLLPGNMKLGQEINARLVDWIKTGVVVPNRYEVVPNGLQGVPEACGRHMTGQVSGIKLVIRVTETP